MYRKIWYNKETGTGNYEKTMDPSLVDAPGGTKPSAHYKTSSTPHRWHSSRNTSLLYYGFLHAPHKDSALPPHQNRSQQIKQGRDHMYLLQNMEGKHHRLHCHHTLYSNLKLIWLHWSNVADHTSTNCPYKNSTIHPMLPPHLAYEGGDETAARFDEPSKVSDGNPGTNHGRYIFMSNNNSAWVEFFDIDSGAGGVCTRSFHLCKWRLKGPALHGQSQWL